MYFRNTSEAKEYDELKIASEHGGSFGGGLSPSQSSRMAEIENASTKMMHKDSFKKAASMVKKINSQEKDFEKISNKLDELRDSPTYYERGESLRILRVSNKQASMYHELEESKQRFTDFARNGSFDNASKIKVLKKENEMIADSKYRISIEEREAIDVYGASGMAGQALEGLSKQRIRLEQRSSEIEAELKALGVKD